VGIGLNRQTKFALPILLIIITTTFNVTGSNVHAEANPTVDIYHLIHVRDGGLVVVTDELMITNNGESPISEFTIGFHSDFRDQLEYFKAYDDIGKTLSLVNGISVTDPEIYAVNVKLDSHILIGGVKNITVTYIFSRLISFEMQDYNTTFPMYPSLALEARSCHSKVILPVEATFEESSWSDNETSYDYKILSPLPPYSKDVGFVTFSGDVFIYEIEKAIREISITSLNSIRIKDSFNIKNSGRETITKLKIELPKDAEQITAHDSLGDLTTSEDLNGETNRTETTVTLRYPLRGTPVNDAFEFRLEYEVSTPTYIVQRDWSTYYLNLTTDLGTETMIANYIIRVILPEGAEEIASFGNETEIGLQQTISNRIRNIAPFDLIDFTVEYSYIVLWAALRPLLLLGLISISFGGTYYLLRSRRKISSISISTLNVDLLSSFIENCEERTALWIELETIEGRARRRGMRRREYRQRRRTIEQRLKSTNDRITSLKNKIRKIGPRYSNLIQDVETAEIDLRTLEENKRLITEQLRTGKISRNAYEQLLKTYQGGINKSRTSIDMVLAELRRDLR
jgi:hypothetical protein